MAVYLQNIATAVPEGNFKQSFLREKMKDYVSERQATRRIINTIYKKSGIEKRHTVVNDFHSNGHPRLFFQKDGTMTEPSTGARNKHYTHHAKKLFVDVGKKLLKENTVIDKKDITHVITVSCTGFFAPDPACEVVKQLELDRTVQRFHVGFMGCFAAFPALKMARSFCVSNPDAVVMVICVELCSIHFQASEETDQLIAASVFADGGAGALVSTRAPENQPAYRIEKFHTSIVEETEKEMAWSIGDTGFDMVLSTYVPDIIESNLKQAIQPLIEDYDIDGDSVSNWAVHPGGRAILDKIEESLNLSPQQLESSRRILSQFGNMSSATILFVLNDLLNKPSQNRKERSVAMAFGPGLTVESALLTKLN